MQAMFDITYDVMTYPGYAVLRQWRGGSIARRMTFNCRVTAEAQLEVCEQMTREEQLALHDIDYRLVSSRDITLR